MRKGTIPVSRWYDTRRAPARLRRWLVSPFGQYQVAGLALGLMLCFAVLLALEVSG